MCGLDLTGSIKSGFLGEGMFVCISLFFFQGSTITVQIYLQNHDKPSLLSFGASYAY